MQILQTLARAELTDGFDFSQLVTETIGRMPRDATVVAILPHLSPDSDSGTPHAQTPRLCGHSNFELLGRIRFQRRRRNAAGRRYYRPSFTRRKLGGRHLPRIRPEIAPTRTPSLQCPIASNQR